jgi:hypothetical protein
VEAEPIVDGDNAGCASRWNCSHPHTGLRCRFGDDALMAGGPSDREPIDGRCLRDRGRGPGHSTLVCSVGYGTNTGARDSATCGRTMDGTNSWSILSPQHC